MPASQIVYVLVALLGVAMLVTGICRGLPIQGRAGYRRCPVHSGGSAGTAVSVRADLGGSAVHAAGER